MGRKGYKQTKTKKIKDNYQLKFRPSNSILEKLDLYKLRKDLPDYVSYQQVIVMMIHEYMEYKFKEDFFDSDPSLIRKLRREKDRTKWVDLIIDENLTPDEIAVAISALEVTNLRMEREK
jgi:hypothetical protein